MPTQTTNFDFLKPLVNNPIDEDLWGGQLNANWDSVDTIIDALMPIGSMIPYAGTTAPNARWLLCDGSAVSRTTYAALFTLVATAYGVGDGSTTFNLPDYRGRAGVGLDNMGGSSADRITDANADSLNNTGGGVEDISLTGSTDGHGLIVSEIPAHTHDYNEGLGGTGGSEPAFTNPNQTASETAVTTSTGGGAAHAHDLTGVGGDNTQPWIAEGRIIRVL